MWRAFLCAGRFLTRLPLPDPGCAAGATLGRSVLFYPVVGLGIGALVWGLVEAVAHALPEVFQGPLAALALIAWVWLSGGLHLDGLADSADAWVGGLGDRERTLEILRDPQIGTMGALALGLALLAKWAGLSVLVQTGGTIELVWLSALARGQLLLLMLTTGYARPQGLGADVATQLPRGLAWAVVVLVAVQSALTLGLWSVVVAGATFFVWRRAMVRRLGGFTGDTAGALVELTEVAVLLVVSI
jgi:adenosylcobinamide-GDP ribazoletransferase